MNETISIDIAFCFSDHTWETKSTVWVDFPVSVLEQGSEAIIQYATENKLYPFTNGEPESLVYAFVSGYVIE